MKLNFTGELSKLEEGIDRIQKRLDFKVAGGGIEINVIQCGENINVKQTSENSYCIEYPEKIHFFRALGLLLEKLKGGQNNVDITEIPYFKTNGIMADCSRNAVLTVESIRDTIEIMAIMGLNMLMLYTEDTYDVKEYPYFGYMRGRYSYEELKECDDYAALFGVEMVPCIQTLGHLTQALKWNYANRFKDTDDILLAGNENTYNFIENTVRAATAPFRSNRIHIGMDEAHNVGLGKYLTANGYRRRFDILNEHLTTVRDIVKKLGLKPMMWSDMYFRLGSKNGEYYDETSIIPKSAIDAVPKDVELVYWDYYHNNKEEYDLFIKKHRSFNNNLIFAGGIWTWNGFSVNYDKTFITTNAALAACKKQGVKEVFAAMWADNGAETNFFSGLLGMQLYAEHGYSTVVDTHRLEERFKFCTGQNMDAFLNITRLDGKNMIEKINFPKDQAPVNPSKYLLWQDVLMGLFDKHFEKENLSEYYSQLAEVLKRHAGDAYKYKFVFDVPAKLAEVLSVKADIGVRLKKSYDEQDTTGLRNMAENDLPKLYKLVEALRTGHRSQWFITNKPFGWEVIDMRYGGLLARIDTAIFRISEYLNAKISNIAELNETRLNFDYGSNDSETIPRCNRYNRIVSANVV